MFLVNSRLGLVSATPLGFSREDLHLAGAHLLPKLRWHFAEFLNESSLTRLGILSPSTCVGLRYGHLAFWLEDFLGSVESAALRPLRGSRSRLGLNPPDLPEGSAYSLGPGFPAPGPPILLRPPFADNDRAVVQDC